jgi:hypothetical protein
MTSKDKTGDQLVASIRKTKSGAAARNSGTQNTSEKQAAEKPASEKPAPARKPATPKSRATKPKSAAAKKSDNDGDAYSCGRRVWPD